MVGLLERLREADATTRQRTNGPTVGATSPAAALQFIARTARPGGFIVVVSDFRGLRDWRTSVIAAAARHEVLAVEIRDAREERLPAMGELTLIDPETGRQMRVDVTEKLARRYRDAAAEERAGLSLELRRVRVDHAILSTRGEWLRALALQLRARRVAA